MNKKAEGIDGNRIIKAKADFLDSAFIIFPNKNSNG